MRMPKNKSVVLALSALWALGGCGLVLGLEDHGLEEGGDASADASDATTGTDGTSQIDVISADVASADGSADALADVPPGPLANRIFVTSTVFPNAAFGGRAGADAICQAHADDAGLDGSFVALVSTSAAGLGTRVQNARGWVRLDGRPVADTPDQLVFGKIWYPIALDEHGNAPRLEAWVATGATSDGGTGQTCNDWTSTTSSYICGYWPAAFSLYLYGATCGCTVESHLYCLEVSKNVPVSPPAPVSGRFAFVSHGTWNGIGGLVPADNICKAEAAVAGLPGSYKALLSTSVVPAASRFDASTGTPNWTRIDGIPIFADPVELPTDRILIPLVTDADGGNVGGGWVWTGATSPAEAGAPDADTCSDWTGVDYARAGFAGTVSSEYTQVPGWFGNYGGLPCGTYSNHLYCFQE